jgi:hypothetical protein
VSALPITDRPGPEGKPEHGPLDDLAGRARPVTLAGRRVVPVLDPLAPLFPDGGMRRGSTLSVAAARGGGATSLALALIAATTRAGSWAAAVGPWSAEVGLVAAAELGVCLERFALVPDLAAHGPAVLAALVDAVDVVLVGGAVRPGDARRLTARARERGAVLVAVGDAWPERTDLRLTVTTTRWQGVGQGFGHLRARQAEVVAAGRGAASRRRQVSVWLPAARGGLEPLVPIAPVAAATAPRPRAGRAAAAGPLRAG